MYQEEAERLYRATTPYGGVALDHHCIRLAEFSLALGREQGVELDEDLVRAVTWIHDIGLMVKEPGEPWYPRRGLNFAHALIDGWNLEPPLRRVVDEMMLFNHSFRPVEGTTREAEMLRLAVQVEHSVGVVKHGLARSRVREVFRRWPRRGLTRILIDFARITLVEDGPGEVLHIFSPAPSEPRS